MKRFLLSGIAIVGIMLSAFANAGGDALNKVINTYKASKGISVDYVISSTDGKYKGKIAMQGNKFCMTADNMVCWYDGKTQWSYSTISAEVAIMEPTKEELQVVNPMAIISSFQSGFTASVPKASQIKLVPKKGKSSDYSSILITTGKNNLPTSIVFVMKDHTRLTITLSNYLTNRNFPASTFVFNKAHVPAGTPIVDLR